MHPEAYDFVLRARNLIPKPQSVLEIGSRNVNGTARDAFDCDDWFGIDKVAGECVDLVADFHDVLPGCYDLVVCCEVLEHEMFVGRLVDRMVNATRVGGHLLITCATNGRAPHGANGAGVEPGEHYRNVEAVELLHSPLVIPRLLETYPDRGDLYALLVKVA